MKSLLILGAGGHGKVVAETALALDRYSKIAFLDDKFNPKNEYKFQGIKIIGNLDLSEEIFDKNIYQEAIVAIGDSITRINLLKKLKGIGYKIPNIIHPSAWVSPSSSIKEGTVIFAQSVIQSEVEIGFGGIINTACSIDHDSIIHEGVHICPGARLAGAVEVGDHSIIGIGSTIIKGIKIGKNVIIGAGAAVVSNFDDNVIAMGVPAKVKLN